MYYPLRPHTLKRTVAPASSPVTLDEFKLHARIDIEDDDALATSMIAAATNQCEKEAELSLITQTWQALFTTWCPQMLLWRPPVASITSVEYLDGYEVWQTVDDGEYYEHLASEPAFLQFKNTFSFPSLSNSILPIRVTYQAGYGNAAAVPENAKRAICLLASHYYEQRQLVAIASVPTPIIRTFRSLVDSIRVPSLT
jgi:uncharacterized phiE125 gp8 family phage protein